MNQIHTFSLLPLIRKRKNAEQTQWPVFRRVTVDGKAVEISTKQATEPSQWNKQKGRVRGNSERARIINATIETFENKAKQYYQQLLAKGKGITAHIIKDAVLGKEARYYSLMKQFNKHVSKSQTGWMSIFQKERIKITRLLPSICKLICNTNSGRKISS